jgi:very-short-patch-repair endonuclease
VGPYIADFYCDAHKLIVEVDGGQHQFDRQAAHDAERDAYLRAQGYRVLRISQLTVLNDIGAAFAHIRALLGIAPE